MMSYGLSAILAYPEGGLLKTGMFTCRRTREGIAVFITLASACPCFPLSLWAHDPENSVITLEKDIHRTVYTI
jgi:hypothetical protein